jgi:hypothetical protein
MAPTRYAAHARSNNKTIKRTIKFLASNYNKNAHREVVRGAPDKVIKLISDAALNVLKNPQIPLTKKEKNAFLKNKRLISSLSDKKKSLAYKRKAIQSGGGFGVIPLILSTVLGTVGSAIINKIRGE